VHVRPLSHRVDARYLNICRLKKPRPSATLTSIGKTQPNTSLPRACPPSLSTIPHSHPDLRAPPATGSSSGSFLLSASFSSLKSSSQSSASAHTIAKAKLSGSVSESAVSSLSADQRSPGSEIYLFNNKSRISTSGRLRRRQDITSHGTTRSGRRNSNLTRCLTSFPTPRIRLKRRMDLQVLHLGSSASLSSW
jgi:hypothetical protein